MLPGFQDADCNILLFGLSLVEVSLRDFRQRAEVAARVDERAREFEAGR
jgi:predicted amidohydrolase YtcJ